MGTRCFGYWYAVVLTNQSISFSLMFCFPVCLYSANLIGMTSPGDVLLAHRMVMLWGDGLVSSDEEGPGDSHNLTVKYSIYSKYQDFDTLGARFI